MTQDVRVCFVGDSFVAGVGDPRHLGWVGRLASHSHASGHPLTSYNLGVRRDTSADVLARWRTECSPRLPTGCTPGVVISFGVNDANFEEGAPRVERSATAANLDTLLVQAAHLGWPVLVAGPNALLDEERNDVLTRLDKDLATVCAQHDVPYVSVLPSLRRHDAWVRELREGDGAHPGAEGYEALTALLLPAWESWLATL